MDKQRELRGVLSPVSSTVPVADVMTRRVVHVGRETPIRHVVERMCEGQLRSVVVTDGRRAVGIVTNSDVVVRGQLGVRLTMLPALSTDEQVRRLNALPKVTAEQVMSTPLQTLSPDDTLDRAAVIMVHRRLKRLPVVDDAGALIGIVSRVDLLRTVAGAPPQPDLGAPKQIVVDAPLTSVMRGDVPMVYPDSPLAQVVQAVIATRLNRALVVSRGRRVLGIIHDRAVLARVTPALHPPLVRSLVFRLPFLRSDDTGPEVRPCTAADIMSTDVSTAHMRDSLGSVTSTMVEGEQKLVAVVDDEGRIVGVVDRADVLRGIANRLVA